MAALLTRSSTDDQAAPDTTSLDLAAAPVPPWTLTEPTVPYTFDPYQGLGAWVDVFDWAPAYTDGEPTVTVADLDAMAAYGVRTVYLQAARRDDRAPEGLVDPELLAEWLERAHDLEMAVVAWYLPTFVEVADDLERLDLLRRFTTDRGDTFDGLGVDIEVTSTVADDTERSARLIELSVGLDEMTLETDVLSAIVLPPTLLEVVNPEFWPTFPWARLARHYEVWQPMNYWSGRTEDSGFRDGAAYNDDAVARLRTNLEDPDAVVHSIGGIGDQITEAELEDFLGSLSDTGSIGGSIYDYRTLSAGGWSVLRDGVAAASAPAPPPLTVAPDPTTTGVAG